MVGREPGPQGRGRENGLPAQAWSQEECPGRSGVQALADLYPEGGPALGIAKWRGTSRRKCLLQGQAGVYGGHCAPASPL